MSNPTIAQLKAEELEQIRGALAEAVQRRTLRGVARELGMSPTGLRGLIDGADPYVKTWDKLRVWSAVYQRDAPSDLPTQAVAGFLHRLLRRVPERSKYGAHVRVLKGYEEAFHFAGIPAPQWLTEVRQSLTAPVEPDESR